MLADIAQMPIWAGQPDKALECLDRLAQTQPNNVRSLALRCRCATMLDRLDRMQQFLSTRLEALQAAKPAVQALYQALTPEQRAIFDHPFRR